jgi:hypothetical protein
MSLISCPWANMGTGVYLLRQERMDLDKQNPHVLYPLTSSVEWLPRTESICSSFALQRQGKPSRPTLIGQISAIVITT